MDEDFIKQIDVLLVEDSKADARLTKEALLESKLKVNLEIVYDGEEALFYLKREGKYSNAKRPDLILLDLNLPKKDGKEVLKELKEDIDLRKIPVVVLTISKSEKDILKSYDLGANCFITKPVDLEQFMIVVNSIENFWFTIVKLPSK